MIIGLWLIILIEAVPLGWLVYDKFKRPQLPKAKALDDPHGLLQVTYKKGDYSWKRGWFWACNCGTSKLISERDTYDPTEEQAVRQWKAHRGLHQQLALETGENEFEKKYLSIVRELDEFKKQCYCKDIH